MESIDESVRDEICSKLVLFGRTALVSGLISRLQEELRAGMTALGVGEFDIVLAEERGEGILDPNEVRPSEKHNLK